MFPQNNLARKGFITIVPELLQTYEYVLQFRYIPVVVKEGPAVTAKHNICMITTIHSVHV